MEEYDPEDGYTREDLRSFYMWEVDEMAEGIKLAIDTAIGFTESHVEDEVTYDLPF